ncbi:MAG TPA: hypothetical protein VJV78_26345, partial [Polyangiales bacterium]|nr:hypothetical protein [Polyangiales bacterium]
GAAGALAAGSGGAPAAAGCGAALFCDGFEAEGTMPAATSWEVVAPNCKGDAAVEIDSTLAHSGTRSAKLRSAGGYCNHLFIQAKPSGALPDPLFARVFVRLDKALTSSHVTFLAMKDGSDGKDLRMGGQNEILMWNRESDDATLPELSPAGIALSKKPATQTWLCLEFEVDSKNKALHTWLDGQPVEGLQVDGEGTPNIDGQWRNKADWQPKPQDVRFGWESYGSDANTLWFDDVALGSTRIGCNP